MTNFTHWELTTDGKYVPFSDMTIPVSFISKYVPGVEIWGHILKLPLPFLMLDVRWQYRGWCKEQAVQKMEIMNPAEPQMLEFQINSHKVIFQGEEVYASFLNERIPGCVLTEEELRIPTDADTTNIINQYHLFLKEQEEKHNNWLEKCRKQKLERTKSSNETNTIESILEEREKTHGKFCDHAYYTQSLKSSMHESPNWVYLDCSKKESLEMIAHKIGRILAGDPNLPDHWDDIAGYAKLISQELAEQNKVENVKIKGGKG